MSILFYVISGLLFGAACVAFSGSIKKSVDRAAIYFIASGVFAIAGTLA